MSKINVESIKDSAEKNYYFVANLIRQHGTPNPQFPADKDIEYSQLRDLAGAIAGLGTILKNMKLKVSAFLLINLPSSSSPLSLVKRTASREAPRTSFLSALLLFFFSPSLLLPSCSWSSSPLDADRG